MYFKNVNIFLENVSNIIADIIAETQKLSNPLTEQMASVERLSKAKTTTQKSITVPVTKTQKSDARSIGLLYANAMRFKSKRDVTPIAPKDDKNPIHTTFKKYLEDKKNYFVCIYKINVINKRNDAYVPTSFSEILLKLELTPEENYKISLHFLNMVQDIFIAFTKLDKAVCSTGWSAEGGKSMSMSRKMYKIDKTIRTVGKNSVAQDWQVYKEKNVKATKQFVKYKNKYVHITKFRKMFINKNNNPKQSPI